MPDEHRTVHSVAWKLVQAGIHISWVAWAHLKPCAPCSGMVSLPNYTWVFWMPAIACCLSTVSLSFSASGDMIAECFGRGGENFTMCFVEASSSLPPGPSSSFSFFRTNLLLECRSRPSQRGLNQVRSFLATIAWADAIFLYGRHRFP